MIFSCIWNEIRYANCKCVVIYIYLMDWCTWFQIPLFVILIVPLLLFSGLCCFKRRRHEKQKSKKVSFTKHKDISKTGSENQLFLQMRKRMYKMTKSVQQRLLIVSLKKKKNVLIKMNSKSNEKKYCSIKYFALQLQVIVQMSVTLFAF